MKLYNFRRGNKAMPIAVLWYIINQYYDNNCKEKFF